MILPSHQAEMLAVEVPIKRDEKAAQQSQQTAFLTRFSDQTRDVSMRQTECDAEQEWLVEWGK